MDETWRLYAKWNKLISEKQINVAWFHLHEDSKTVKLKETESRMMAAKWSRKQGIVQCE